MATEITNLAQEQLWLDAPPGTTSTGNQTRDTLQWGTGAGRVGDGLTALTSLPRLLPKPACSLNWSDLVFNSAP